MTTSWYVLQSKPRKEEFLCDQLFTQRVETYCPCIRVHPVNPRSKTTVPYFPGYVFVQVDLEHFQMSTLRWLPGAIGLVSVDREPAYVPESLLAAIRFRVDTINLAGGDPRFISVKPGDSVHIQNGPFAGYEAIFDSRLPGSDRVRVLLSLLRGRQIPVELPSDYIQYSSRV
jgi:transcriptional antiterminator RfaH